jgi:DNA polymerase elongation subunit (family B)
MITIDIETYADLDVIDLLPVIEADSRLKDEEKIKTDIEKKKEKQIEQMALNPLYGKIACIGYYSENIQEVDFGGDELSEKVMIENFLKRLQTSSDVIVTWNGNEFDLPFIFKRGLKYGLCKLTDLQFYTAKTNPKCIDLMRLFAGWNKYEKLDNVAKVLLGESKEEFDVKEIPELLKTQSGQELIKRYCLKDCELTYKLGELMI